MCSTTVGWAHCMKGVCWMAPNVNAEIFPAVAQHFHGFLEPFVGRFVNHPELPGAQNTTSR